MIWSELTKGVKYITDMGKQTYFNPQTRRYEELARYAVWVPTQTNPEKHAITEVSNDLKYLKKKYKIKTDDIFQIF